MQVRRLLAYAVAALAVAWAAMGWVWVAIARDAGAAGYMAVATVLGLASVSLGVVVATKRPDNLVGALLTWVGLMPIDIAGGDIYAQAVVVRPDLVPVWAPLVALTLGSWMFLYVPPALLALVFPDGHLPAGRRWRWLAAALIVVPSAFTVLAAFDPAPFPPPFQDPAAPVPGGRVRARALRGRHRPATGLPRPADRHRLVGGGPAPARDRSGTARAGQVVRAGRPVRARDVAAVLAELSAAGRADLVLIGLTVTYLAIPVATAIAVLRHDLYDVDRAFSAAVTYGIVTTGLLAFYTAATFLAGIALGHQSAVAAAAATAVCAVALAPLRTRLQRWVDRRFYPLRRAALVAIEDLRAGTHAGTAVPEELEEALRTALRDPAVRIGYRLPGSADLVDARGAPFADGGVPAVPVRLGGADIGVLCAHGSRELLREVGTASALLVEVVRLRIELSGALRDVESSRSRLLTVSYEERRRLERDLHDGAQQRLVALGMALRLGQRHLDDGRTDVSGLLDPSGRGARHGGGGAAADRPWPAPEQPGRRSGERADHDGRPGAGADHAGRGAGGAYRWAPGRSGDDRVLRGQRGGGERGPACVRLGHRAAAEPGRGRAHRPGPRRRTGRGDAAARSRPGRAGRPGGGPPAVACA
jgi:signal transduction histidine kinase